MGVRRKELLPVYKGKLNAVSVRTSRSNSIAA
jgi:hypothetical protein